jgi:hypothetical protein
LVLNSSIVYVVFLSILVTLTKDLRSLIVQYVLFAGTETISTVGDLALSMLHETQWDEFVKIDGDGDDSGGVKRLMNKQLKKMQSMKERKTQKDIDNSVNTECTAKSFTGAKDDAMTTREVQDDNSRRLAQRATMSSIGSSKVLSTSEVTVRLLRTKTFAGQAMRNPDAETEEQKMAREAQELAARVSRNQKIEQLLEKGERMMNLEVFAIPKLHWSLDDKTHPDERRALDRAGFLIESYHVHAWWWEIFEMVRKLLVTGTISIIPGDGVPQITFAFIISSISFVPSLYVSPFINRNVGRLHVLSLSTQCITLFAALMIEQASPDPLDDSKRNDEDAVSDILMQGFLVLMNVSIFLLPAYMVLENTGFIDSMSKYVSRFAAFSRKCLGIYAKKKDIFWVHQPHEAVCTQNSGIGSMHSAELTSGAKGRKQDGKETHESIVALETEGESLDAINCANISEEIEISSTLGIANLEGLSPSLTSAERMPAQLSCAKGDLTEPGELSEHQTSDSSNRGLQLKLQDRQLQSFGVYSEC